MDLFFSAIRPWSEQECIQFEYGVCGGEVDGGVEGGGRNSHLLFADVGLRNHGKNFYAIQRDGVRRNANCCVVVSCDVAR